MPDDFTPIPADEVYKTQAFKDLRRRLSPVRKYMGHLNRGVNAPTPEPEPEPKVEAKTARPKAEPKVEPKPEA